MKMRILTGILLSLIAFSAPLYADTVIVGAGGLPTASDSFSADAITATSLTVGAGTAAAPSVTWGDGDTGFYQPSNNTVYVSTSGTDKWFYSGGGFFSINAAGLYLNSAAGSSTVPNIIPNRSDLNTGYSWAAADQYSLISGSIETFRGYTTQLVTFPSGTGQVTITDEGNLTVDGGATINTALPNISAIATFGNLSGSFDVFRVDASPESAVTANRGDLAVGINGNAEGAVWVKHIGDANNTGWAKIPVSHYGDMHVHDNISTTTITTTDVPHMISGRFAEGTVQNFTFVEGSAGTITAFAEYSTVVAGTTLVTDATHGLATGDNISIVGTTDYNDVFAVTVVTADTFYIAATFTSTDTGTWSEGDYLLADTGAGGVYRLSQNLFATAAVATTKFEFEPYINDTRAEVAECIRNFATSTDTGSCSGGGLISISDGDRISFAVINLTDATNILLEHVAVILTSL